MNENTVLFALAVAWPAAWLAVQLARITAADRQRRRAHQAKTAERGRI